METNVLDHKQKLRRVRTLEFTQMVLTLIKEYKASEMTDKLWLLEVDRLLSDLDDIDNADFEESTNEVPF